MEGGYWPVFTLFANFIQITACEISRYLRNAAEISVWRGTTGQFLHYASKNVFLKSCMRKFGSI
jgi:hypothetical protein